MNTVFDWQEHIARVRRWHKKVREIYNSDDTRDMPLDETVYTAFVRGHGNAALTDDQLDILFAFFQNCFHLYDFLKNSGALTVEELRPFFFELHDEMKICHDICIGAKHLQINRPLIDSDIVMAREYVPPSAPGEPAGEGKTKLIKIKDKTYDLVFLAMACMRLVDEFLAEHKLA